MPTNTAAASALIFTEGFDDYNNFLGKWTNTNDSEVNALKSPGRLGYGQCINIEHSTYQALQNAPYNRLVFGCAIYINYYNANNTIGLIETLMAFIDTNASPTAALGFDSLGRINFAGLQSNPNLIPSQRWTYLEMDVIFAPDGTGSFAINCNGEIALQGSSLNTATTNQIYGIWLGPTYGYSGSSSIDDVYVVAPNTMTIGDSFLGDIKIVSLLPNGNGQINQFTLTGPGSANWMAVNDNPPDNDTSYVASNNPGDVDLYTIPDPNSITPCTDILGVSVYALARKDDAFNRVLSVGVSNGTTEEFDSGEALGLNYNYIQRVMPINPLTGQEWTLEDFNALQIGIKLID